jgi:hypothetical protein
MADAQGASGLVKHDFAEDLDLPYHYAMILNGR